MTDPAPIPASDDSYRPVSGLALSGLIVSALFAVLIVASLIVGIVKGTPIFFPIAIVLVAVVGFGLSFAGYRQIATSEGTRVGVGIARLGMGLAVVTGLGYAAYSISIGLAVATQAEDFLAGEVGLDTGFLTRLQQGPKDPYAVEKAFLLTLPPSSRGRAKPEDELAFRRQYDSAGGPEGQGHLTIFRNGILARMLCRGGQIESLGMRGWEHDKQSYKVARGYRLLTPEGALVVTLEAESAEGEVEGQSRRWFVNYARSGVESTTLTPLGQGVQELQEKGRQFLQTKWLKDLRAEKLAAGLKKIKELDKSDWENWLVRDLPERMVNGKNVRREHLKTAFHAIVAVEPEGMATFAFSVDPRTWPTWNHDADGKLRIREPFTVNIPEGPAAPPVQADGWIRIRTTAPLPTEKMASPVGTPEWEVESIVVDRIKLR